MLPFPRLVQSNHQLLYGSFVRPVDSITFEISRWLGSTKKRLKTAKLVGSFKECYSSDTDHTLIGVFGTSVSILVSLVIDFIPSGSSSLVWSFLLRILLRALHVHHSSSSWGALCSWGLCALGGLRRVNVEGHDGLHPWKLEITSAGRPRNGASPPLFVTITRFPFMLSGKSMTIS